MGRINKGSLLAILFVSVLAIASYSFKIELMKTTRAILENELFKNIPAICISIIVISHSIKTKPENDSSNVMIRSGFRLLDTFLTLGTYILVTRTACSLLEGAFVQTFFDVEYFAKFNELDVYVLLGVVALLLWYVAFNMYKMINELLFNRETISSPIRNV